MLSGYCATRDILTASNYSSLRRLCVNRCMRHYSSALLSRAAGLYRWCADPSLGRGTDHDKGEQCHDLENADRSDPGRGPALRVRLEQACRAKSRRNDRTATDRTQGSSRYGRNERQGIRSHAQEAGRQRAMTSDGRRTMIIRTQIVRAAVVLLVATGLCACGGDTVVKVEQSTQISKGWELKDLRKALDAGAVTKDEYEQIRQKLLKRAN